MYAKPKLEKYGAFREITRIGLCGSFDFFTEQSGDGWETCSNPNPTSS